MPCHCYVLPLKKPFIAYQSVNSLFKIMDLFPPLLFCVVALVYVVDTRADQTNYAAEPVAGRPRVNKRNANAPSYSDASECTQR